MVGVVVGRETMCGGVSPSTIIRMLEGSRGEGAWDGVGMMGWHPCGVGCERCLDMSQPFAQTAEDGGLVGNVGDMSGRHVGVVSCRLIFRRHSNVADIVTGIMGESRAG